MAGDPKEGQGPRGLQFEPFSSCIEAGFWNSVSKKKLEEYGLDETPKPAHAYYSIDNAPNLPCLMNLDHDALDSESHIPPRKYPLTGKILICNTTEGFQTCNKQDLADNEAEELWKFVLSGEALRNPSVLSRFLLLTFMDLKKYTYTYWFLFPALSFPDRWVHETPPVGIDEFFSPEEVQKILSYVDKKKVQETAFLIQQQDVVKISSLEKLPEIVQSNNQFIFAICDASVRADNPGWTARNLLALLAFHIRNNSNYKRIHVLCFRDRFRDGRRDYSHSIVFDLRVVFTPAQVLETISCPKGVGWEKNDKGKLAPRHVDLSAQMDPRKLAEQAVDLNLKLMKWRLVPDLDLPVVANTKCLILGSGTLGCNVARCLMGWGVKNVTFVDNARISYSNPVRQSLFTFEDCLDGGKLKAQAAADGLKKIFPGMKAEAHQFSIPMPGHSVSEGLRSKTMDSVKLLEDLIESHDVIYLLMDTRESRWLPTLIAAAKKKIVINAALGFDSYLVMRHGVLPEDNSDKLLSDSRLGCYFCNDVVAPGDSTKDRTLDQQCTVTRPGVSMIAAALAVELMVTVLEHPDKGHAPADTSAHDAHLTADFLSPLGIVPHMIRCFLSRHNTLLPASPAFDKCTACSMTVIEAYRTRGNDFLWDVFNHDHSFLEDLTGLTKLKEESEILDVFDLSDDE